MSFHSPSEQDGFRTASASCFIVDVLAIGPALTVVHIARELKCIFIHYASTSALQTTVLLSCRLRREWLTTSGNKVAWIPSL